MRRCLLFLLTIFIVATQARAQGTREDAIRTLIKTFADARNAHDGDATAALYSEDGEWIQNHGVAVTRGKADLSRLWSGVTGHVDRTITSIDFPGSNIAVVRVATEYGPPIGLHSEVFILVNAGPEWASNWKICVHQTLN